MHKPSYNFVDATFRFFQVMGRRPGAVLWILLWQLGLYAALSVAVVAAMAPIFLSFLELAAAQAEPDPTELLRAMPGLVGGYALAVLGFMLASLIMQGAWLRLLAREEVAPIIPLRIGGDELRLLVVNLAFIAFGTLAALAFFVGAVALLAPFLTALEDGGDVSPMQIALVALSMVILGLTGAVVGIFVMLRFAAAPALSVRMRAIKLFESFSATRGVVSWMFVSYLTLVAGYLVGAAVVGSFQQVFVLLFAAELFPTVDALQNTQDPEVIVQVLGEILTRPAVLVSLTIVVLLQLMFQILFEGSWHGVGAYVARREAGDYPDDAIVTPSASVGDAPSEG